MSLLIADMTREEAQVKHNEIKQLHTQARGLLLEIRDRNGWKALGFESFEDYGAKEWGYSRTYINRLAKAEEIQKSLDVPIGTEIPESQLRPLAAVPEEKRQEVFTAAKVEAEQAQKPLTAKIVQKKVDDALACGFMDGKTCEVVNNGIDIFNPLLHKSVCLCHQHYADYKKGIAVFMSSKKLNLCEFEDCENDTGAFHSYNGTMYCEQHYAIFSAIPAQSKAKPVEPRQEEITVYDEVLTLNLNEYYGSLAESLIFGLKDAMKNMASFNQSKLTTAQLENIRSVFKKGTADQLSQSIELLRDSASSLEFLLTGKVENF